MVADALELDGWEVFNLGANNPTGSIVTMVRETGCKPHRSVGLVATPLFGRPRDNSPVENGTGGAVRPRIMLGGVAINQFGPLASLLGADSGPVGRERNREVRTSTPSNRHESKRKRSIDSLRAVTAVAIAEIDLSGLLLDANAGFLRLLPAGGDQASGIAVAPSFISPSFARLIELSSSGGDTLYEGLMTLGDPTGKSRSLRGSVSRTERGLFLLLEYDVEELSHVVETALELSGELAEAQRDLLSMNNQLEFKEAERAQSELRLRRNESLLAEAQRLAKVGSWNWDILSDKMLWSDEHYRIFGLNAARVRDDLRPVPESRPPGRPGDCSKSRGRGASRGSTPRVLPCARSTRMVLFASCYLVPGGTR